MEQSSKALYIAGATLIAILVLSMFVYMFMIGSRFAGNYEDRKKLEQVEQFNSKFEIYQKDENTNTISDVITVANFAYSINQQNNHVYRTYSYNRNGSVIVEVNILGVMFKIEPTADMKKNYFFKCTSSIVGNHSHSSGEVSFYDLMGKNIADMSILGSSKEGKLSDSTLIETEYGKSERVYRYYFNVGANDITYNNRTYQVESIRFLAVENTSYPDD